MRCPRIDTATPLPWGRTWSAERVVVRRLVRGETGPSGGPAMTDVLGVCESWTDGVVVVRREQRRPGRDRHRRHRLGQAGPAAALAAPPSRPRRGRPPGPAGLASPSRASRWASGCCAPPGASPRGATRCWRSATPGCRLTRRSLAWPSGTGVATSSRGPTSTPVDAEAAAFDGGGVVDVRADAADARPRSPGCCAASRRGPASRSGTTTRSTTAGWPATSGRPRYGDPARQVLEAGEVTFATVRDEAGAVAGARTRRRPRRLGRRLLAGDARGRACVRASAARCSGLTAGVGCRARCDDDLPAGRASPTPPPRELYESYGYEVHHRYDYLVLAAPKLDRTGRVASGQAGRPVGRVWPDPPVPGR